MLIFCTWDSGVGSVSKVTCHQNWKHKLHLRTPRGKGRKPKPTSCPLTSTHPRRHKHVYSCARACTYTLTQAHNNKLISTHGCPTEQQRKKEDCPPMQSLTHSTVSLGYWDPHIRNKENMQSGPSLFLLELVIHGLHEAPSPEKQTGLKLALSQVALKSSQRPSIFISTCFNCKVNFKKNKECLASLLVPKTTERVLTRLSLSEQGLLYW